MEVGWLEQSLADVRSGADWLSAREVARLGNMRIPKRSQDWRLGRWTAKQAVAAYLELPRAPSILATIEIRPAASGAPEVFLHNTPAAVSISLSHRAGCAACAIAPPGTLLGCDLEAVEPRGDAFLGDYFAPEEQQLVRRASSETERFRILALLWSAKESTLKALREGLRLDPRCIEVELGKNFQTMTARGAAAGDFSSWKAAWHPLCTYDSNEQVFQGWWQCSGELVRTLVSAPASPPPVHLNTAGAIPVG